MREEHAEPWLIAFDDVEGESVGQTVGARVDVSSHRVDGSDAREGVEHGEVADVARVEDGVRAHLGEQRLAASVRSGVRVGDDGEAQRAVFAYGESGRALNEGRGHRAGALLPRAIAEGELDAGPERVIREEHMVTARRQVYARYPETDDMGEHELQRLIAEFLRPLLERWFAARSEVAHVGADQFFYWVEGDPTRRIAPDVYVVPGVAQNPPVASWKLWESSARPSFALEVVGQDIDKDYDDNPVLYAALGVRELVLFDPHATSRSRRRLRWQVFRRLKGRGLVRVEVSNGDRVQSKALGC